MGNARARKIPARLVEDEDYQLRHERVAGIDIAKAKADVCTRLPPAREGGRRASRVEEAAATAAAGLLPSFFPMLSMIGHPSGDKPLMMDVRQSLIAAAVALP